MGGALRAGSQASDCERGRPRGVHERVWISVEEAEEQRAREGQGSAVGAARRPRHGDRRPRPPGAVPPTLVHKSAPWASAEAWGEGHPGWSGLQKGHVCPA